MERELFLTGYCRQQDQSRMVTVVVDGGEILECDCCYGACIYEPNCPVAARITEARNA